MEVHYRPGDTQVVKLLASAHILGQQIPLQLKPLLGVNNAQQGSMLGAAKFIVNAEGRQVTDANAIIVASAGKQLDQAASKWLEWEEAVLRPAVLLARQADAVQQQLTPALQHLAAALTATGSLSGLQIGLADVIVAATLLPLVHGAASTVDMAALPAVAAWLERCQQHEALSSALKQVVGDAPEKLVAVWAEDAAVACMGSSRAKLPQPGKRNVLITSALPYVNNVPHLGNIIGCVLSADVYARYCRARGYNTLYICGTDEYGTATETKALEENMSCADLCDKYHAIHAAVYQWFDIQFDKFGRTPTRAQTEICQAIFKSLQAQGCLEEQTMEQLYSEALGKFLADRFVTGTCPKCKYEDARGDQCDNCGALLNPTELINPKCKITGTTPVIRSTRHLFLDLPALASKLQAYQDQASSQGGWSSNCVQLTAAWMRDGLRARCITRDLKWGVPVPAEGFTEKVFYVWFDAPIGYISITANYTPNWEQWWRNPEHVELVQFMGKDNVPFHTVVFPASLLGTNEKWTMMRNISVTEYLNYEGGKFSKSRGTGVFGSDAKDTGIPVEVWRYYLLSVRPEQQDTDFKWSDLQARNNSELLANIGNFINRGLQFVVKFFDGRVPATHPTKGADAVAELGAAIQPKVSEYISVMEKQKLRDGIRLAMLVSADGNKFIQDTKPWVVVKEDPEHCGTIVAAAVGVVRLLAALVAPYMPSFSRKVLAQLALPESALELPDAIVEACAKPTALAPPPGHVIGTPAPLVSAISDDTIAALRAKYGGSQAERDAKATASASAAAGPNAKAAGKGKAAADKSTGPKEAKPAKEPKQAKAAKEQKAAAGNGLQQASQPPQPEV